MRQPPPIYVEVDGAIAAVTGHLVTRWRELVCPLATRRDAVERLEHWLRLVGHVEPDRPSWVHVDGEHGGVELVCWIVAGDYAIPIADDHGRLYCPTVIARGALTTTARQERNERRAFDRRRRSARRRSASAMTARSGDRRRRREQLAPGYDLDGR